MKRLSWSGHRAGGAHESRGSLTVVVSFSYSHQETGIKPRRFCIHDGWALLTNVFVPYLTFRKNISIHLALTPIYVYSVCMSMPSAHGLFRLRSPEFTCVVVSLASEPDFRKVDPSLQTLVRSPVEAPNAYRLWWDTSAPCPTSSKEGTTVHFDVHGMQMQTRTLKEHPTNCWGYRGPTNTRDSL
jgi:hypothetical protein